MVTAHPLVCLNQNDVRDTLAPVKSLINFHVNLRLIFFIVLLVSRTNMINLLPDGVKRGTIWEVSIRAATT